MDKVELYESTVATARSQGNKSLEAGALGALGNTYAARGDIHRAIDYQKQSMRIYESLGNGDGVAVSCVSLAGCYEVGLNDLQTAIEYFEKAVAYASNPQLRDKYSRMLEIRRQMLRGNR